MKASTIDLQSTFLVADLFCGAGGSSTGAQHAIEDLGSAMDLVAINHWNTAIATHQANHPTARHLVEDVSIVDPEAVVPGGRLDLLMASPECRFYSRARGGKPIHDQGRMNPWAIHNWLTKLDVRCVIIENVPEFVNWGPLDESGRPDKSQRGKHFEAWFLTFHALGYTAEWKMLNAADYGDATTRTRFFLLARKDGRPTVWPEPSHARGDTGMFPGRQPWRGAKEIINWENLGRSLLDDPKYRKRPLSPKTRRRIAKGLQHFGGPLAPLYIRLLDLEDEIGADPADLPAQAFILNRHGENGTGRFHSIDDPFPTVTCQGGGYLVNTDAEPFLNANRTDNAPKGVDEPVPCITTAHGGGSILVEPDLRPFMLGQQSAGAPRSTEEPTPTIATAGKISLVRPTIIQYYGQSFAQDTAHPLSAITGCRKHAVVSPVIVEYYGNSDAASIDDPLHTVTTKARHGLANPAVIKLAHGNGSQGEKGDDRRVHSVDKPLGSITTSPGLGLAQPIVARISQTGRSGDYSRPLDSPLPTMTTKGDLTLTVPVAQSYIVPNFGEASGQEPRVHDVSDPLPKVTSRGAGNLVTPTIAEDIAREAVEAGIDPRRIVFVDGQPHLLDIRFRMLENAELARAMGFDDEESQYEFVGNISEVTKQIGNAVPVHLAAALVRATLSDAQPTE